MGSYAHLYLDGLSIWSTKSVADPDVMTLFSETDRRERRVPYEMEGRNPPITAQVLAGLPLDAEDIADVIEYSAEKWVIRDRLELMGFTLPICIETFRRGVEQQIQRYSGSELREDDEWFKTLPPDRQEEVRRNYQEADDQWEALCSLTFERWLDGLRELRTSRDRGNLSALARYMKGSSFGHNEHNLGWAYTDIRYFIRAALEILEDDDWVVYDVSEVVRYTDDEDWVRSRSTDERIVVLTEGVVDRRILGAALHLLYPHLVDYFFFFDLDAVNAAGGAAAVVSMVKAFVGAGIKNRVIALLDNDTAAASALRGLARVTVPDNIRVVRYPDLPLAEAYPTLGPSGLTTMNVNGLAGSIELYLGRDALAGANGALTPVQWRGYDAALQRYQGEVLDKRRIQEAFDTKVAVCTEHPEQVAAHDWSGVRAILDQMRTTFVADTGELYDVL